MQHSILPKRIGICLQHQRNNKSRIKSEKKLKIRQLDPKCLTTLIRGFSTTTYMEKATEIQKQSQY